MGEWDFSPEVIAKAQEIGIGARVAVHWSEAECQDQEGTVVGVDIHRYGKVDYTVHIDGDLAPTDGFVHDRSGIFGGTIRLIAPSLSLEEEVKRLREALQEFGTSRVRDRIGSYVGCNRDLLHDALQAEVRAALKENGNG